MSASLQALAQRITAVSMSCWSLDDADGTGVAVLAGVGTGAVAAVVAGAAVAAVAAGAFGVSGLDEADAVVLAGRAAAGALAAGAAWAVIGAMLGFAVAEKGGSLAFASRPIRPSKVSCGAPTLALGLICSALA